jgi:hypothetical protein
VPQPKQQETPPLRVLPPLENGDCLHQPTFRAWHEAMPEDCRAELVGGIVYTASPLKLSHGCNAVRRRGKFVEMASDADGIHRSPAFPGVWLAPIALTSQDRKRILAVLRQGLASKEHAAFVARLTGK